MTIIGLNGYAGSGKDAVAAYLVEHHDFARVAFADPIKKILYDMNPFIILDGEDVYTLQELVDRDGWDETKSIPEVRDLLQRLGVAAREHIYEDVWIDVAFEKIKDASRCVVTDCRFINEVDMISDLNGGIVRVMRPGVVAFNAHVSEKNLDEYQEDASIWNDSSHDDLGTKIEEMLLQLDIL